MDQLCQQHHLLFEEQGVVRVPFLVKGQLVLPPELERGEIEAAFSAAPPGVNYVKLAKAQIIRLPVIDRRTMRYTSEYLYQVMPLVNSVELIETDTDKLARGPYALPVDAVLQYLQIVSDALLANAVTANRVRELYRRTAEQPDIYLDGDFAALLSGLAPQQARCLIENELSIWNVPGSKFLDGWVEVPGEIIPGLVPFLAQALPGETPPRLFAAAKTCLRAMPTRQLHITAGNAPQIPIVSAMRLILTKSAGVIKCPAEAVLPGALLALAAAAAAPDHPLTQNLSLVYWPGGDESVESVFFLPGAFDRIVVWGAPEAVRSVQSRAVFTKTICFNPRYGVSLIGREAFDGNLESVAFAAAMDIMIYSQKACSASLVQYVEGTEQQVKAYADCMQTNLARWDQLAPSFIPPAARGQLKRLQRGKYMRAQWLSNTHGQDFTSGVVIMPDEFDILDHPMSRLVVIRRVDNLLDVFKYLHPAVSMAGVYPEEQRLELRDRLAARGVSSVLPLGQCERVFPGMSHDGMMVLNQLVDWKVA